MRWHVQGSSFEELLTITVEANSKEEAIEKAKSYWGTAEQIAKTGLDPKACDWTVSNETWMMDKGHEKLLNTPPQHFGPYNYVDVYK